MSKVRDYFSLSEEEIINILEQQDYKCEICGCGIDKTTANADHCHLYNEFRSFLCSACNLTLGHARDNPDTLRRAADYLEYWNDIHSDHLKDYEYYV